MRILSHPCPDRTTSGFTLVELLVAMAVTGIVGSAIVMIYISQSRTYTIQRELAHMQQNLRAAMYMLQNDIRNSGRDPDRSGRYGIQSITRSNGDTDDPNGYPGLTLTSLSDADGDGLVDSDSDSQRTITYRVMDQDGDGHRELRRCTDPTGACPAATDWELVMDSIEDIGFAYAYDNDNGDLARIGGVANNPEIWAIDSNNSNDLDTNIDDNGDGNIDSNDGAGTVIAAVPLNRIRAVRIWLLARSRHPYPNYTNSHTYVLGRKVLDMTQAANANRRNFRHLLLEGVVALQNYQLDPNL